MFVVQRIFGYSIQAYNCYSNLVTNSVERFGGYPKFTCRNFIENSGFFILLSGDTHKHGSFKFRID